MQVDYPVAMVAISTISKDNEAERERWRRKRWRRKGREALTDHLETTVAFWTKHFDWTLYNNNVNDPSLDTFGMQLQSFIVFKQ